MELNEREARGVVDSILAEDSEFGQIPSNYVEDLQFASGQIAKEKGFKPGSFAESCMLMGGEIDEAYNETRDGHDVTEIYYKVDSLGFQKPEGVPVELADCVIRIMHWFEINGLNLNDVIVKKLRYNRTRPYKHGKKF